MQTSKPDSFLARVKQVFKPVQKIEKGLSNDTAWSIQSMLYSGAFPQYNPDDLIGRKSYKIYDKMMIDEQVKAVTRFRRESVTGRDFDFAFEDNVKLSDEEKERRIALSKEIVSKMKGSFKAKLDCVMASLHQGFSLTEKTFSFIDFEGKAYYGINNLTKKPVHTFNFYLDEFGQLVKFTQLTPSAEKTLDINKFIHHVQNPDVDEYFGRSELREAYRSYWSKDVIIRMQNIHLERHGTGFMYVVPKGDKALAPNTPAYTALQEVLSNLQTGTGAIFPAGVEAKIVQPQNTDGYERAVGQHDKAIAKSLLMPNLLGLSEQGNMGSNAQAKTQLEAFLWILDAEAKSLEETLNEQLFKQLAQLNWGDEDYPRFVFNPLSKSMVGSVITMWKDLVTAGAVQVSDTDETHLRDMLSFPEVGEVIEKPQQPSPFPPNNEPSNTPKEKDPAEEKSPKSGDPSKDVIPEETIVGKSVLREGFTRALRRVDFTAIDNSSNAILWSGVDALSGIMFDSLKSIASIIVDNNLGTQNSDPKDVAALKFPTDSLSKLKKASRQILNDGWKIGEQNAKREISVAKKESINNIFTVDKFASIADIATRYFASQSFIMAGNLSDQSMSTIKAILMNGIRYSKTTDQVVNEIYTRFATDGLITVADAEEALGQALDVETPTHRLNTIVRTNSFTAINEARFAFFTDPDLAGFVQALEYSAILDGRTTNICQELDNKVYPLGSAEWEKYRPPNHFNCRSVLVPVTERDKWETSNAPGTEPQKGFA